MPGGAREWKRVSPLCAKGMLSLWAISSRSMFEIRATRSEGLQVW